MQTVISAEAFLVTVHAVRCSQRDCAVVLHLHTYPGANFIMAICLHCRYGRWTGKAYSPRELVEIQGWENGSSSRRGSSKVKHSVDHGSMSNLGTPVLEVFVKQQQQQYRQSGAHGPRLLL